MGKKTKLREAQRAHAADAISAVLAAHSKRREFPTLVASYGDLKPHYRARIEAYRADALRAPEKWRCRAKSRRDDDRFLNLVEFAFARYAVPAHLANVWVDDVDAVADGLAVDGRDSPDFKAWYIAMGRGESLYRYATHPYLTKLETHHFLTAPPTVTAIGPALWYAVARAATSHDEVAVEIANSQLNRYSIAVPFWKEVARFFARNAAAAHEVNTLIDYIAAAKAADDNFSLAGRTLGALHRRNAEWQRVRAAEEAGCTGSWSGRAMADAVYETGSGERLIWRFRQIKTGLALFQEGRAMSHCVATYHGLCRRDDVSIWSLTCEGRCGTRRRRLTIEVRRDGDIGQCRGFANRTPYAEEEDIIARWASDFGLGWRTVEATPAAAA